MDVVQMATSTNQTVLVTGASGFLGMHCVMRLLKSGYAVRGTVRSVERGKRAQDMIARHTDTSGLSLVQADLSHDEGWNDAVGGCTYVLHVASPVPRTPPKTADEVIGPARDGVLRVLSAAARVAGVKRVVMTSSIAAVIWGQKRDGSKIYDENDWTVINDQVGPYERSKTLAERAAWEFVGQLPSAQRFELVTINPGLILGPVLGDEYSISGEIVRKLLTAALPGCPALEFSPVDVRDVAEAHVLAMINPQAAGKRFIVGLENTPWLEIAQLLASRYTERGYTIPARRLPSWVLKVVAVFDRTAAVAVPELGKRQDVTSERARKILGLNFRDLETMVFDMADSMIELGVVPAPKRTRYAA
jgi:dihydroflavonol-4-reductase